MIAKTVQSDPTLIPPMPEPPQAKSMVSNLIGGVGVVMMLLGWGYQSAAKDHPEDVSNLPSAVDWAQLAGFLIAAGGYVSHTIQAKSNEKDAAKAIATTHASAVAAITAADLAPPTDPATGQKGSVITAAAAVEQAMNEGNHALAIAMATAVKENSAS